MRWLIKDSINDNKFIESFKDDSVAPKAIASIKMKFMNSNGSTWSTAHLTK